MKSFEITWDRLKAFESIWKHLKAFESIWNHLKASESDWRAEESENYERQLNGKSDQNLIKLEEDHVNHGESLKLSWL